MSTEPIAALHAALAAAQGELTNPPRTKEISIPSSRGAIKFAMAPLGAILDGARAVLAKHGLSVSYTAEASAVYEVAGKYGPQRQMLYTVTAHVHHAGGGSIAGLSVPVETAPDPRSIGSCITYARRYSLSSLLGVAPDDDDDAGQGMPPERQPQRQPPKPVEPTPQQRDTAELRALAKRAGITAEVKGDVARYLGAQYNLAPDAPPGQWLGVLRAFDRAQGISNLIDAVIAWDSRNKADEADKESDKP